MQKNNRTKENEARTYNAQMGFEASVDSKFSHYLFRKNFCFSKNSLRKHTKNHYNFEKNVQKHGISSKNAKSHNLKKINIF